MKHRYELKEQGRLIASGNLDQLLESITEMRIVPPDERQMRESLKLSGEFHFYMGLYEVKKISNQL